MGYDDALDAFGVHAIGGLLGGVMTAFFAEEAVYGGTDGILQQTGSGVSCLTILILVLCSVAATHCDLLGWPVHRACKNAWCTAVWLRRRRSVGFRDELHHS